MENVDRGETYLGTGDYILGTPRQDFFMVGKRESIISTKHRMVLVILTGEGVREHRRYNKERTTWPITEATGGTRQDGDENFMALKRRVNKPSRKDITMSAPWISDTTWRLSDQR